MSDTAGRRRAVDPGFSAQLERLVSVQQRYPLMQGVALIVLFGYGALTLDNFASYSSIKTNLIIASFLAISAVGQQVILLLGGIDLGVPAYIALGNFMVPQLVGINHWPFWTVIILQLAVTSLIGGTTGYICSHFKVESLVVTLGVQTMILGGLAVWTNGIVEAGAPQWLSDIASPAQSTFGIPVPPVVAIWALIAVLMAVLLYKTVTGRRIYAAGANPTAASTALVPIERIWVFAFALSAVAASFTGLLLAGFSGTGDLNVGNQYLFSSLAAVIVGGTSLIGARGDYWRTVIGALLLTELTGILIGHGLGAASQQIVYGLVILLVVPAYGRLQRTADRI